MQACQLIAAKRDGREHSSDEIRALVSAVVDGSMPDYQVAAWLMAAYLRGLGEAETVALTLAMRDSGETLDLSGVAGVKVDKHSTGGVGDKTTLVVVPIVAAAGVPILKMSGRGLGFSGGTIDKLEAIPGFRTELSVEEAVRQTRAIGAAIVGQSARLAPADKRLYALRDVTATVESMPLIAASIMSKKLAGGADAVVLDVKVGRGAFMKDLPAARELARRMAAIGQAAGVRTVAYLTAMDAPLGWAVGNALEVREACDRLAGRAGMRDGFTELCLGIAAAAIEVGGASPDRAAARALAEHLYASGAAAAKLEEIVAAQGGDAGVVSDPRRLPRATAVHVVGAPTSGWVTGIDAEVVGRLAVALGAGRQKKDDAIDPSVGIVLRTQVGGQVSVGEALAEIHAGSVERAAGAAEALRAAFSFAEEPPEPGPMVLETVG